jgi:hypothetical protein
MPLVPDSSYLSNLNAQIYCFSEQFKRKQPRALHKGAAQSVLCWCLGFCCHPAGALGEVRNRVKPCPALCGTVMLTHAH